jgi:hypothetical protein
MVPRDTVSLPRQRFPSHDRRCSGVSGRRPDNADCLDSTESGFSNGFACLDIACFLVVALVELVQDRHLWPSIHRGHQGQSLHPTS